MKKSFNMLFVFVFLAVCIGLPRTVFPGPALDAIEITRGGEAMAVIVIPDDPHRTEEYAAEELQKYLEQVSGARLDIIKEGEQEVDEELGPDSSRLFVGNVQEASRLRSMLRRRDQDAFVVRIERQQIGYFATGVPGRRWDDRPGTWHDVFLFGATERATLWAVYDFLERELGCRWLGPGELWEVIPERADIKIPVGSRIEESSMKYRFGVSGRGYVEGRGFRSDLMEMSLRVRRGNTARRPHLSFDWAPERARRQLPLPVEVRGWNNEHSAPPILRAASRDNSEWFAMSTEEGVRSRPRAHWQICFSNPEARDLLADKLSRMLREHPEWEFVEAGCLDGLSANYCRCEGCADLDIHGEKERSRRGGNTHAWLAYNNAIASYLAESDPGKKLIAAAYGSYQEPPDPDVIRPLENVMINYFTWDGCRLHGYEHEVEHESRLPEMSSHETHREWIDAWLDMAPAGVVMAEYLGRGSMDGITGTNPRRYINDIAWLHGKGFVGYIAYDYPSNWGMRTLNRYAVSKAIWNVNIDPDEVVRDFCDHAFGAGSEDMQKFVNVIQDAMLEAACSHVAGSSWTVVPGALEEARRHLESAKKAAAGDDDDVKTRLLIYDMHFRYAELAGPAYERWYRVVRGDRDPDLMREAIRLGTKAAEYRREKGRKYPRNKYPDLQFGTSPSIIGNVQEGGSWHRLLEQLEAEQER